ncbi:MAG: hypothetical protein GC138_08260 [Gammaproteobacteria bacterium]|nr:hypothetical protein [Gammaproteobacteria bacterium]
MFGYITGKSKTDTREESGPLLAVEQVAAVMEHFQIGGKIRYAPDYRPEVTMDSLIIAYGINNHLVYAQRDICLDTSGKQAALLIDEDWKERAIPDIRRFCIILPDIGNLENVLDYDTRVRVRNGGQLQRGDRITLMSLYANHGLPHIDTMVRKRVTLRDGYYANHSVIVLEVEPQTLRMVDQRQHYRIRTHLPVTIRLADENKARRCVLVDYSENSLRLSFDDPDMEIPPVARQRIYVNIDFDDLGKSFTLQAKAIRKGEDFIVLRLTHIKQGDEYVELGLLEALDIKASLLQLPNTR